jgi:hypothetical protein
MPDALLLLRATGSAAGAAAVLVLLFGIPWTKPQRVVVACGWVLGLALGFYLGAWLVGAWPHLPPSDDQDRLLLILMPAAIAVELTAAILAHRVLHAWVLRLVLAGAAGNILLHGTSYLADLAGPGSAEWSLQRAAAILGGLALSLAVVWAALALLSQHSPSRSLPICLAIAVAAAAAAVMLSGYTTGGQLGVPLAGALVGGTMATLLLRGPAEVRGSVGLGVIGLFAVLLIGRFFGQLTTTHAVALFFAPLLCWVTELPYLRRLGSPFRAVLQILVVASVAAVVVYQAYQTYLAASGSSAGY